VRKEDKYITGAILLWMAIVCAIYASVALPQIAGLPPYYPFDSIDYYIPAEEIVADYWAKFPTPHL